MKRNHAFTVAISVSLVSVMGLCQVAAQKALPIAKTLVVNGKRVQTSLVQIDNRLYASVDDLASSLDGSLTSKATTVELSLPIGTRSQDTSTSGAVNGAGTVKG